MSGPFDSSYAPVGAYSPLGNERTVYTSPGSYARPFPANKPSGNHSDLEDGDIEMASKLRRPDGPRHGRSYMTMNSTFYSNNGSQLETRPFLRDPMNDIDSFHAGHTLIPYQDHSWKQLGQILKVSSVRWLITFLLCAAYVGATKLWEKRRAQSAASKKVFNAVTTGISIALGLNVASAFRDMALNMRWPILSGRKRSLVELDLILNSDSLMKPMKLMYVTRRPLVVLVCTFWLIINLLVQTGIAMLSLTYNFEVDYSHVRLTPGGVVAIPDLQRFYPDHLYVDPSSFNEYYVAHMFGAPSYTYGVDISDFTPVAGTIYQPAGAMLYYNMDARSVEHIFSDSPEDEYLGTFSVYTSRKIRASWNCSAKYNTAKGNVTHPIVETLGETLGNDTLVWTVPNYITYFTAQRHLCKTSNRCSIVQALEMSDTVSWHYTSYITLGETLNDDHKRSFISDEMAQIASASIAQVGYTYNHGLASQIYPPDSRWGGFANGSADDIGLAISVFAMGTIAGATMFNPYRNYTGDAPRQGMFLNVGHPFYFHLILALICGCHLLFIVVVAVLTMG